MRTRSGCADQALSSPKQTVSSIYLTVSIVDSNAVLSWTQVANPPLPSSNANGQGLNNIYREFPAGNWEQIGISFGGSYSDPMIIDPTGVNYRVELADLLPCVSASNVAGYVNNGLNEWENDAVVVISPNPNNGLFSVSLGNAAKIVSYRIIDAAGRSLDDSQLHSPSEQLKIETYLPSGTYFFQILTEKGMLSKKLVIVGQ